VNPVTFLKVKPMTKAASLTLGMIILAGPMGWAQPVATDAAISEAVRRQANTILLRQKLADAQVAQSRQDLPVAVKLYEDAYTLVEGIGDRVSPEAATTVAGLTSVRLELARAAQKRDELNEVRKQLTRVLKVDPKNKQAIAGIVEIVRLYEAEIGRLVAAGNDARVVELAGYARKIDPNRTSLEEFEREARARLDFAATEAK